MQKNHDMLLKKLKNTDSAQLWILAAIPDCAGLKTGLPDWTGYVGASRYNIADLHRLGSEVFSLHKLTNARLHCRKSVYIPALADLCWNTVDPEQSADL